MNNEIDYTLNDPQIREMNKLLKFYPDTKSEGHIRITEAINNRMDELGVPKRKVIQYCENIVLDKPTSSLNPDGRSRACSCGARHTAFPNHHLSFCDMKTW